jgi:pimeloyl-[acyl-carrier protein] methyl ester esterase
MASSMDECKDMVWIHGWGTNSRVWREIPTYFPNFNHRYRSFRNCKMPEDFLPAVEKELGNSPVVLIGWSMGGMLAIEAAMRRSGQVCGVINFCTSPRFVSRNRQDGWPKNVIMKMRRNLETSPSEVLIKFIKSMWAEDDLTSDMMKSFMHDVFENDPMGRCDFDIDGLIAGLDYLLNTDLTEKIQNLKQPMLWIHGGLDSICPVGAFHRLQRLLSGLENHKFVLRPNCGHIPFYRSPEDAGHLVRDFLDELKHR